MSDKLTITYEVNPNVAQDCDTCIFNEGPTCSGKIFKAATGRDCEDITVLGRVEDSVEKPKVPITVEDCYKVLYGKDTVLVSSQLVLETKDSYDHDYPYSELINAYWELLMCRDAWYRVLGWSPSWENNNDALWCIMTDVNFQPYKSLSYYYHVLAFPDKETCDSFAEYFRDLIYTCIKFLV